MKEMFFSSFFRIWQDTSIFNKFSSKKKLRLFNSWNLIKITITVITSKSGQGKTYNEYEAGKNAS